MPQNEEIPSESFSVVTDARQEEPGEQEVKEIEAAPGKKPGRLLQSGIGGYIEVTRPDFEQRMLEMMEKMNRKVDSLATSSSSQTFQGGASTFTNAFSKEMKQCYDKMKEWKNVKDIVELVRSIDCLSLTPHSRAAKTLSKDCLSICTGQYLSPEMMTEMMSGKGEN